MYTVKHLIMVSVSINPDKALVPKLTGNKQHFAKVPCHTQDVIGSDLRTSWCGSAVFILQIQFVLVLM